MQQTVVLDSNILIADYSLSSAAFDVFFDYIRRTKTPVILPRLVFCEVIARYEEHLGKRCAKYEQSVASLAACLPGVDVQCLDVDVGEQVARYRTHLLDCFATKEPDLWGYRADYLEDAVGRAVTRQRPCSKKGEEIRDAVLWSIVKDVATQQGASTSVAFVSGDGTAYQGDDARLHPSLAKEALDAALSIRYFASLADFNREHATRVDFLDSDWFVSNMPESTVADKFDREVAECARWKIGTAAWWTGWYPGAVQVAELSLVRGADYIYEVDDGSLRLEVEFTGTCEVVAAVPPAPEATDWYRATLGLHPGTSNVGGEQPTLFPCDSGNEQALLDLWPSPPTAAGESFGTTGRTWEHAPAAFAAKWRDAASGPLAFHAQLLAASRGAESSVRASADVRLVIEAEIRDKTVCRLGLLACEIILRPRA